MPPSLWNTVRVLGKDQMMGGNQVLISVNLPLAGSYIESCCDHAFSGKILADG
jgi:hypothetical protein